MKEVRQLLSQLVAESRRNKRKRDESLNQSKQYIYTEDGTFLLNLTSSSESNDDTVVV